jgi:glycosyltransferase involved in cell wall biosynthesis
MSMVVSVVVPTYRRPQLLARCLTALAHQDYDSRGYEIIVVDDGPDPDTRALVEAYAARARVPLRYLAVNGAHGPAAARNRGWQAAQGHIIAFTDDDTVPAATWMRAGVDAFEKDIDGAWGRTLVPLPPVPTDYEREIGRLAHAECITANCFYRKSALEAVGGFDERFTTAWREDSDVFFALLEHNRRVIHVPDAIVAHPARIAPWGVSLKLQRKSQFNALLYKKHPRLYRQRIQTLPPWRYYAILVFLLGALSAAAAGAIGVAAAAAAGWLGLTAEFCVRRLRATSRALSHVLEMIVTSALIPPLSIYWRLHGALKYRVLFL